MRSDEIAEENVTLTSLFLRTKILTPRFCMELPKGEKEGEAAFAYHHVAHTKGISMVHLRATTDGHISDCFFLYMKTTQRCSSQLRKMFHLSEAQGWGRNTVSSLGSLVERDSALHLFYSFSFFSSLSLSLVLAHSIYLIHSASFSFTPFMYYFFTSFTLSSFSFPVPVLLLYGHPLEISTTQLSNYILWNIVTWCSKG